MVKNSNGAGQKMRLTWATLRNMGFDPCIHRIFVLRLHPVGLGCGLKLDAVMQT